MARPGSTGPWRSGRSPREADSLRIPLDRLDPSKPLPGRDGIPTAWTPLEADDAGRFRLRVEFGPGPGQAYLAIRIQSPRDQPAALRVEADHPTRIYLDGTRLPDRVMRLRAGPNLVIVGVDGDGADDGRIALEIASPSPVEVRNPKN